MRRIDIAIIIVIVAAVIFSGIGVATYESTPQSTDFRVTWNTTTTAIRQAQGSEAGNGEETIDVPIDFDNITDVTIDVSVQGSGPRAQAVTASISLMPVNASAPPAKSVTLAAGQGGGPQTASFTVPIQEIPTLETTSGDDANSTAQQLDEQYRTQNGTGTWRVTVTITGARDGVMGVGGETFTITVNGQVRTYSATVNVLVPDINR